MDRIVKRENWKGRYVFVARVQGILLSWRYVKGSKLTVESAEEKFRRDNTLKKDTKKSTYRWTTGTREVEVTKPKGKRITTNRKDAQYVVKGDYNGQTIAGRSMKLNSKFLNGDRKQARIDAWKNFYLHLADAAGLDYDEDEGKKVKGVTNIREGWVYYDKETRPY